MHVVRPSTAVCTALRSLQSSINTIWNHGSCVCLFHLGGSGSTDAAGRAKAPQQHPQQQRSTSSSSGNGGEDATLPTDAIIITRGSGVTDGSHHQTPNQQQQQQPHVLDALLFGTSSPPNTSSSSGSNAPTTSSGSSDGTHQAWSAVAAAVAGDAYRRGFGAKVVMPPADLLHEPLVEQPATIRLRAYQIGSRVHIGRVLALAQMEGCRTNSGKDYCIIWLQPHKQQQQQRLDSQDNSSSGSGSSQPGSSQGSTGNRTSSTTGRFVPRLQKGIQSRSPLLWAQWQQLQGALLTKLQQGLQQSPQQGQQQQQQEAWHRHHQQQPAEQLPDAPAHWLTRDDPTRDMSEMAEDAAHQRQQQWQQHWQQASQQHGAMISPYDLAWLRPAAAQPMMPPLLVVYRYGSVVLAGTRLADEPGLVLRHVPPEVCYRAGGDTTWAQHDPPLQVGQPAETLAVVVQPELAQPAEKGTDQVLLRVLDIGAVRVLTSVLAQSAALSFYESSVQKSLEHLADWRARHRRRSARGNLLQQWLAAAASRQHDAVMFKVIAASALVITEARELLAMAEPAWAYDAYHSLWRLAQKDFELEQRLASMETKLALVEQEAKHDVKDRTGRRYRRAEQGVVWLLLVSAAIAAYEVWLKAMGAEGGSSRRRKAGREGLAGGEAAAAAAGVGGIESWLDSYARVAAADGAEDDLLLAEQQLATEQEQQEQVVVDAGPPNDSGMCDEQQHASRSASSSKGGRWWHWWPRGRRQQQEAQQQREPPEVAAGDGSG